MRLSSWHQSMMRAALATCLLTASSAFADEAPRSENTDEHPLVPALKIAYDGLAEIDRSIQDYSCTLIKRERIKGELMPHNYMYAKVRHNPFSVYLYFLAPEEVKGREVMYIHGQNENKLRAHEAKGWKARFGVVSLATESPLAMAGNRYPITLLGFRTLTERLIELGEHDKQYGECDVKFFNNAKINGRVCTCIQVIHPQPRKQFTFHLARIFIDDELQIPMRMESYSWPREKGGTPVLEEEYTYVNVKMNQGFTDEDFDYRNENYNFVKKKR